MAVEEVEQESIVPGISLEDAMLAVEVVKKALSFRPFIKEGLFGERYLALSEEQRMEEFLNPRISIFYPDKNKQIPAIFLRITGDEGPLTETFFYPVEAAWSFLDEGRSYVQQNRPDNWTDKQVEDAAIDNAVEMMLIMLDNIYPRALMMMESFTMETIAQWYFETHRRVIHYVSDQGDKVPRARDLMMDGTLKSYTSKVKRMWKNQGQGGEAWRKVEFADEYERLYRHWRNLARMASEAEDNLEDYAKAGQFKDTPDDLLKKLMGIDRSSTEAMARNVSELALEHAARRTRLIKTAGASEWARKKRKDGIRVSDYSSAQLFAFLKEGKEAKQIAEEGRKVQDRLATYPVPEGESDSTLKEKRKLLEQKLEFIRNKSHDSSEPNDGLAMEQKA